jgi:cytochrome c-type biogenesis protein CcmH
MFWIVAASLVGFTCLSLLSALGRSVAASKPHDKVFYETQIQEIERQKGLRLIGEAEAGAARTEAARRLLAASVSDADLSTRPDATSRKWAAVFVLVLVPVIALPIYLTRGSPEMPSFTLANRKPEVAPDEKSLNIANAIQQIEAHLSKNPDDGRGYEVIAPVYARTGRYQDAVLAYGAVLRLLGASAVRYGNLGEAMVFQSNGVVTTEAKAVFDAALAMDPQLVKARFFLALAAQQDGDAAKASSLLTQLSNDLPDGELKTEIANQLRALGAIPQGGETVAALPKEEQAQAIRSMVDGLAQRLATTGGSVEEWARLIRALTVLKETDRVGLIVSEARKKFAANPDHIQMIEDAARVLQ